MNEEFEWSDLPASYAMKSHGYVAKRPDRVLARCSGPGLCSECELERAYLKLLASYRNATTPRALEAKELALDIIQAIGGDRKFWAETQQKHVAKVEKMLLSRRVVGGSPDMATMDEMRSLMVNFLGILAHKNISPPMLPGVQENMAAKVKAVLEKP